MDQRPTRDRQPGISAAAEPVVVYDGECGFCRYGIFRLAARWHLPGRLLAWQDADLGALGLSEDDVRARMWYLAPGMAPAGGAAAVAAWLAGGGRVARGIGGLLRAPGVRAVAEAGYRVIARNRHRIPGPWEHTCAPTP